MISRDLRKKFGGKAVHRGSQAIFGERQHLQEVLRSVMRARLAGTRRQAEARALKKLIQARTDELNRINPGWDRKFKKARRPNTTAADLVSMASALPQDDYLLARALTEHPNAPGELLRHLAAHPYAAARENVARHPNAPPDVLRKMAEDANEPLWFLVACNSSCPPDLRERLRARMQQMPEE